MSARSIILLVLFVITMFLWFLINVDTFGPFKHAGWLPFLACLELGAIVFLYDGPRRA